MLHVYAFVISGSLERGVHVVPGVLRVYAYVISGSLKRNVRVVPGPGLNVSGIILSAIFTTYLAPIIAAS